MSATSIYNKYAPGYQFDGKRVLNAGCGFATYRGPRITNLDAYDNCEPEVVWSLDKTPLPFPDEEFDIVIANHIMEHLQDFWSCFEEFARITKPGGRIEVYVPGGGSDAIFGFRDHVREINANSFYGVHGTYRGFANAWASAHAESPANRLVLKEHRTWVENEWWLNKWPFSLLRQWCIHHLRNVVIEKGYVFYKMTDKEWENARPRTNSPSTVLSLPKVAVSK